MVKNTGMIRKKKTVASNGISGLGKGVGNIAKIMGSSDFKENINTVIIPSPSITKLKLSMLLDNFPHLAKQMTLLYKLLGLTVNETQKKVYLKQNKKSHASKSKKKVRKYKIVKTGNELTGMDEEIIYQQLLKIYSIVKDKKSMNTQISAAVGVGKMKFIVEGFSLKATVNEEYRIATKSIAYMLNRNIYAEYQNIMKNILPNKIIKQVEKNYEEYLNHINDEKSDIEEIILTKNDRALIMKNIENSRKPIITPKYFKKLNKLILNYKNTQNASTVKRLNDFKRYKMIMDTTLNTLLKMYISVYRISKIRIIPDFSSDNIVGLLSATFRVSSSKDITDVIDKVLGTYNKNFNKYYALYVSNDSMQLMYPFILSLLAGDTDLGMQNKNAKKMISSLTKKFDKLTSTGIYSKEIGIVKNIIKNIDKRLTKGKLK